MRTRSLIALVLAPWLAAANGIDQELPRHWADMRIDDYDGIPSPLRDYPDAEATLRKQPPADLAEIRRLHE